MAAPVAGDRKGKPVAGDRKGKQLALSTALAVAMVPIALVGPLFDIWRLLGIYAGSSPASGPAQ